MSGTASDYLTRLVTELRKLPNESEWIEFKENNSNPEDIGEYLSALSNAAALVHKTNAYLIWGIADATHDVVGTSFKPLTAKKGSEALISWLSRLLSPRLHFHFHELSYEGKPVVVLEIPKAQGSPTQFHGNEYIRIGSHRQRLKDHPQIEKSLWSVLSAVPFEENIALAHTDESNILSLLDYPACFSLFGQDLPEGRPQILEFLTDNKLIVRDEAGLWNITNLGAILIARNLNDFRGLARKTIRIVVYEGNGRLKTLREQVFRRGYAVGFADLVNQVNALLPRKEVIGKAIRREVAVYPELAIRELIPNALIHQDFTVSGAGPMIEIFEDRMEITNPGDPLVNTQRFLDSPPLSRNESLASFMRRVGICEERGSGVDKVVHEAEVHQLPAPLFEKPDGFTRAVLFAHKAFKDMDRAERSRACYQHACLRHVQREPMTNASLRARLGITEPNKSMVSRVISDAIEDRLIKPKDASQGKKYAKYLPFWA